MPKDLFKGDSGLLDNADITITDAIFTFDPEYRDGQVLRLELTAQEEGEEEVIIKLGCGTGWTTEDKGQTAVREDGRDKAFNNNTAAAIFFAGKRDADGNVHKGIQGAMDDDRKIAQAVEAKVAETKGLGPYSVDFWKGLQVHVDQIPVAYGGEIGNMDQLTITEVKGWVGSSAKAAPAKAAAKTAKKATKAAAKPAEKAEPAEPEETPEPGMSDELRAKLDALADECENPDEFAERAIAEIPEVADDDALLAAVKDQAPGSIWDDAVERYEAANA